MSYFLIYYDLFVFMLVARVLSKINNS